MAYLNRKGLFHHLDIEFQDFPKGGRSGSGDLKQFCIQAAKAPQSRPTIAGFDRDEPDILKEIMDSDAYFKNWGNNVFSFAIPVPSHRDSSPDVCIELYCQDDEIKRVDLKGRRLFLSNQFDPQSGRHLNENLNCSDRSKFRNPKLLKIVDSDVFNNDHENIALPKSDFADLVLTGAQEFENFSFDEFANIYEIISSIGIVSSLDTS